MGDKQNLKGPFKSKVFVGQRDRDAGNNATREKLLEARSHRKKGDRLSVITNSPAIGVVNPTRVEQINEGSLC